MCDRRFPALKRHIPVYEKLGVEGMSSDEEDEEGQDSPKTERTSSRARRFISHRKHFISQDVSDLNHHLDDLSDQHIQAAPYVRIQGPPKIATKWIPHLPKNGYDISFYYSLGYSQREMLRATPIHDFAFADA